MSNMNLQDYLSMWIVNSLVVHNFFPIFFFVGGFTPLDLLLFFFIYKTANPEQGVNTTLLVVFYRQVL